MNRKLSKEDKLGVGALASLPILQAQMFVRPRLYDWTASWEVLPGVPLSAFQTPPCTTQACAE